MFFRKKESSFSTTRVNLGTHRAGYVKPTKKQLDEMEMKNKISATPYGTIPKHRSSLAKALDRIGTDSGVSTKRYMDFDIGDFASFKKGKSGL